MNKIFHGDSKEVLKTLEDNSVDLLCTDPPYGYSFMGKAWDKALPDIEIFKECLRVLKPGAFAFVMSAPRSDVCSRMAILLEDAGFVISFTPIYWTYASGFPKAMNIGKMVDKREGAEREIIQRTRIDGKGTGYADSSFATSPNIMPSREPLTDAAKVLDGSYGGFQPKPAVEVVIVAMKPLSEKTYVDQALKNGKGITWLDDVRVPHNVALKTTERTAPKSDGTKMGKFAENGTLATPHESGRFPANLLAEEDVLGDHSRFFSLDAWAQTLPFLAVPKASKSEKNKGLHERDTQTVSDGREKTADNAFQRGATARLNIHPTVKPLKLMSYLITLGSRAGDTVLDPFLGSGTTALAAKELKRNYIGIEREQEYVEIAEARLLSAQETLI